MSINSLITTYTGADHACVYREPRELRLRSRSKQATMGSLEYENKIDRYNMTHIYI